MTIGNDKNLRSFTSCLLHKCGIKFLYYKGKYGCSKRVWKFDACIPLIRPLRGTFPPRGKARVRDDRPLGKDVFYV